MIHESFPEDEKTPEKLQIFMLRHGKPKFPEKGPYIYGHTDYPLSDRGKEQAEAIGRILGSVRMDRIISSDLSRAEETARIVAGFQGASAVVETDSEIREIFMGEWEGLRKDEARERYAGVFEKRGFDLENVSAPGGETFKAARDRAWQALLRIIAESIGLRRVLIVAHVAILWGMVSSAFDLRLGDFFRFRHDYCALHLVEYARQPGAWGHFRLARYNWSPVIEELGIRFGAARPLSSGGVE